MFVGFQGEYLDQKKTISSFYAVSLKFVSIPSTSNYALLSPILTTME